MAKFVFSAPQRVIVRLKGDLAKELNTKFLNEEDAMFNDYDDLDSSSDNTTPTSSPFE